MHVLTHSYYVLAYAGSELKLEATLWKAKNPRDLISCKDRMRSARPHVPVKGRCAFSGVGHPTGNSRVTTAPFPGSQSIDPILYTPVVSVLSSGESRQINANCRKCVYYLYPIASCYVALRNVGPRNINQNKCFVTLNVKLTVSHA